MVETDSFYEQIYKLNLIIGALKPVSWQLTILFVFLMVAVNMPSFVFVGSESPARANTTDSKPRKQGVMKSMRDWLMAHSLCPAQRNKVERPPYAEASIGVDSLGEMMHERTNNREIGGLAHIPCAPDVEPELFADDGKWRLYGDSLEERRYTAARHYTYLVYRLQNGLPIDRTEWDRCVEIVTLFESVHHCEPDQPEIKS